MLITHRNELRQYYADHRVWQGIPGIVCTPKGREFVSFYSGNVEETYGNFAVVIKRDKGGSFGDAIAVAEKPGRYRCFDPVLWIDPLGRLWFIWNVMPGEQVMAAICSDPDAEELVWGEEFCIGRGIMMNKPVVLRTGEWLFPIAFWKTDIYYKFRKNALRPEDVAGSYVYKTIDNGKTFVKMGYADCRNRTFDEHMVLEMDNGVLMMLIRTSYGIGASYSYDRGKTWSHGENSGLGGPNSRFHICRLRSGRVLLINHVDFTKRDHLTALLSEDGGRTFPHKLLLDERESVSYPDAMEAEDGYIYITYDRKRGCNKGSLEEAYANAREILTARITEEDILAGKLVCKGSYLREVASKLGTLSPECGDPYSKKSNFSPEMIKSLLEMEKENVLDEIFDYYQVDCTDTKEFNSKKLDELVASFQETGSRDEKLVADIIGILEKAPPKDSSSQQLIDRLRKYMEEHLKEDISLSSVANQLNVSKYYLSHLFKSVTGITVTEFRNELRLTVAKNMLIGSKKSIDEIAEAVGFASTAYFTEIFTRSEKVPPREYRKYHQR